MRERGRDFFIMSLARDLHMTRWQLLNSMDSRELTMWEVYLAEIAKPEEKKQDPEVLKNQLKNAFAVAGTKKKKKK